MRSIVSAKEGTYKVRHSYESCKLGVVNLGLLDDRRFQSSKENHSGSIVEVPKQTYTISPCRQREELVTSI